jgi:hypothetical protein
VFVLASIGGALVSVASIGWNDMLGDEYNEYANRRRSARDVAMNLYIGVPGRPPEEGIEIPLMHELLMWSGPFTTALFNLTRGENAERARAAISQMVETVAANSVEVSFPTFGQAGANLAGLSSPDSLVRPADGVYKIRDDELGVLPENIEHLARTLFAGIGDTAIVTLNALSEGADYGELAGQTADNLAKRAPIIKNVTGRKTANTFFSLDQVYLDQKAEAADRFREYWDTFFEPKRKNEDGLDKPQSKGNYTKYLGAEDFNEDLPFLMVGPSPMEEVVNPLYARFGPMIVDGGFRGELGMTALQDRANIYSKYARQLREYNAGNGDALREWQALLNGIEATTKDTEELKNLVTGYDLSVYTDRVKMINLIEEKRSELINAQIGVYEQIEEAITQELHRTGELPPDKRFDITEMLDPHDATPLD